MRHVFYIEGLTDKAVQIEKAQRSGEDWALHEHAAYEPCKPECIVKREPSLLITEIVEHGVIPSSEMRGMIERRIGL